MSVCTYVRMYACTYVRVYACMHACVCGRVRVCMYACMYVCMYVYALASAFKSQGGATRSSFSSTPPTEIKNEQLSEQSTEAI